MSGAGSIEVDQVQPRRSGCEQGANEIDGRPTQYDLLVATALEADCVVTQQVYGRDYLHADVMACYHADMTATRTRTRAQASHPWLTEELDELFAAIVVLPNKEQARRFFRDLCTLPELEAMARRLQVARLVDAGVPYLEIARRTGASTATVTRVAQWLNHGEGGYRAAIRKSAG